MNKERKKIIYHRLSWFGVEFSRTDNFSNSIEIQKQTILKKTSVIQSSLKALDYNLLYLFTKK